MANVNFKYDVVCLIELIESKPCLWDKTNDNNKNKILRQKSWQDIFAYLEVGYDNLTTAEKKQVGDMIMKKWGNIRDSFMRSLRTKTGREAKRKYMYSEHLQFLLKTIDKCETSNNLSQDNVESSAEMEESLQVPSPAHSATELPPVPLEVELAEPAPKRRQKSIVRNTKKRRLDVVEQKILSELRKTKSSNDHTDHELLMLSFVPYIRDMSETELMDLQMEILVDIKSIKQKRNLNVPSTVNSTLHIGKQSPHGLSLHHLSHSPSPSSGCSTSNFLPNQQQNCSFVKKASENSNYVESAVMENTYARQTEAFQILFEEFGSRYQRKKNAKRLKHF